MPPVRTMTTPKPLKTERTHEENQERAYIAASRRSDRSLEARVESARRASEIHKRRTGRSLRVTEQDVVNEEMYEEEDDDLPMQYRRLTAHLQTTNADFDRRLAAYLTNHVAMRTALGQAVSDSYANQYPNNPQFANQMGQFQSNPITSMAAPQQTSHSPQMYRQSPYPMNNGQQQNYRNMHNRSASIATPQELQGYTSNKMYGSPTEVKLEDRRMSLPVQSPGVPQQHQQGHSPVAPRTASSSNLANLKLEAAQQGYFKKGNQSMSGFKQENQSPDMTKSQAARPSSFPSSFSMGGGFDPSSLHLGNSAFSMSLPVESQQLLSGAFDPNDPMTSMLMGNDHKPQQPFYSYNPNGSSKKSFNAPSTYDGMNQTLAPSVLDTPAQSMGDFGVSGNNMPSAYSGFGNTFDAQFDVFQPSGFSQSGQMSGSVTPTGDRDWQNLIDGNNMWEEQPSSEPALA